MGDHDRDQRASSRTIAADHGSAAAQQQHAASTPGRRILGAYGRTGGVRAMAGFDQGVKAEETGRSFGADVGGGFSKDGELELAAMHGRIDPANAAILRDASSVGTASAAVERASARSIAGHSPANGEARGELTEGAAALKPVTTPDGIAGHEKFWATVSGELAARPKPTNRNSWLNHNDERGTR